MELSSEPSKAKRALELREECGVEFNQGCNDKIISEQGMRYSVIKRKDFKLLFGLQANWERLLPSAEEDAGVPEAEAEEVEEEEDQFRFLS